jgi:hypothetical protein
MRIIVFRNKIIHNGALVDNYSSSIVRVLRDKGHEVIDSLKDSQREYAGVDLALDIDCGRNPAGKLLFRATDGKLPVKSAVMFIDTHGYPDMHEHLAPNYDHVFFAVWDKRDRFSMHPSAHWCPNFTDKKWFNGEEYGSPPQAPYGFDFGFFGSKGGLERAARMKEIATANLWKADVREVGRNTKQRWPATAEAMANCRILFNHGQKHDDPNLRVMESMLMKRPLITGVDDRSGMSKLFVAWKHFIPYESYSYSGLDYAMHWAMTHPKSAKAIATEAYIEVMTNHLVENRVSQILEVCS